ncbi:Hypothetical protein (plasmid) [Pseudomonas putida]|nr:Hypothetical protein [Pseudomonas putida]
MSPGGEFNEGHREGKEGVPEPLNKKAHAAELGMGLVLSLGDARRLLALQHRALGMKRWSRAPTPGQ